VCWRHPYPVHSLAPFNSLLLLLLLLLVLLQSSWQFFCSCSLLLLLLLLLLLFLVAAAAAGGAAAPPPLPIPRVLICLPLLLTCLSANRNKKDGQLRSHTCATQASMPYSLLSIPGCTLVRSLPLLLNFH
jgi:uncharacterized membrane protein YfhO